MGDDPDTVWMTYEDAGRALGIKTDSVRRRAAARKWPRRKGNDGLARVGIPSDVIPELTPDDTPALTGDDPDASGRIREELAAARAEADGLRDRLADAHAERDRLADLLDRALQPRPSIFSKIFRR